MRAMIASAVLLLPLAAATAEAQQQKVLSQRVAKSMPSSYRAPDCGLKSGHFKVSSGASYLKTGIEADVPENQRARARQRGEGPARGDAAERPGQQRRGVVLPGTDLSPAR